MGQGREIEQYSKRFVILQLQNGNLSDAHDELKKMVVYGQGSLYLDLFNRLDEAMRSESNVKEISETVVRALKTGILHCPGDLRYWMRSRRFRSRSWDRMGNGDTASLSTNR